MSNIEVPGNLNKTLLENALARKFQSQVEVLTFEVSMASKKGDNYTSDIFRTKVKYELNGKIDEISIIVKYCKEDEEAKVYFDELHLMTKEIEMYEKILPKFGEFLEEKFGPDCYLIIEDPVVFVFEDMNAAGYKVADRFACLDLDHCKILLEKLGKFHAVSIKMIEKYPNAYKNFNFGMYRVDYPLATDFTVMSIKDILEVVKTWEGFEKIAGKLEKINGNLHDKIFECLDQFSEFPVLNHGDVWTNNVMFKYQEGSGIPEDVVFIDYQIPFYTSLGIDYNYFLYSSPTQKVRDQNEEDLLRTYYETFSETLKKLDCQKVPTFEQVRDEIRKFEFYGLLTAVSTLPAVLMEKKEEFNYDGQDWLYSEAFRKEMFQGKRLMETLKPILLKLDKNGVFN